jgi:hypothetical protein
MPSNRSSTAQQEYEIRAGLEMAIGEAWSNYRKKRYEDTSASYQEGFADGLERALLIIDRVTGHA